MELWHIGLVVAAIAITLVLAYWFEVLQWLGLLVVVILGSLAMLAIEMRVIAAIGRWVVPEVSPNILFLGTIILVAVLLHQVEFSIKK